MPHRKLGGKVLWRTAVGNNLWMMTRWWWASHPKQSCPCFFPFASSRERRAKLTRGSHQYKVEPVGSPGSVFTEWIQDFIFLSYATDPHYRVSNVFLVRLPSSYTSTFRKSTSLGGFELWALSPCVKAYVANKVFECLTHPACPGPSASGALDTAFGSQQATDRSMFVEWSRLNGLWLSGNLLSVLEERPEEFFLGKIDIPQCSRARSSAWKRMSHLPLNLWEGESISYRRPQDYHGKHTSFVIRQTSFGIVYSLCEWAASGQVFETLWIVFLKYRWK